MLFVSERNPAASKRALVRAIRPILLAAPVLVLVGLLVSTTSLRSDIGRVFNWYDPLFLYYNGLLALAAVAMPLVIAILYTGNMKAEKKRRLQADLSALGRDAALTADLTARIMRELDREFRMRNYIGSVGASMLVTAFGAAVLLFLKPLPPGVQGDAIDFGLGANFLMLGPFMAGIGDYSGYWQNLIYNLTAFMFGFLGAWVYFITHLMRHYFTCDLTPNSFIIGTVRMITASLLALVLGYVLPGIIGLGEGGPDPQAKSQFIGALAVIGFFFGYFPSRALLAIEKVATGALRAVFGQDRFDYNSTSLSALPGVSYQHELRLQQEGIDSIENLSRIDPVELAIRTRFGIAQLQHWVDAAWLRIHLGADWEAFVAATGITSRGELCAFLEQSHADHAAAQERLCAGLEERLRHKVAILCAIACASDGDPAGAGPRGGAMPG